MKNKEFIFQTCPSCGKQIDEAVTIIHPSVFMGIADLWNEITPDETLRDFINSYGGYDTDHQLKQIVFKDNEPIPELLANYLSNDRKKIVGPIGDYPIHAHNGCPHCHSLLPDIHGKQINNVINVLLVGLPSSSKTSLLKAIFDLIGNGYLEKDDIFSVCNEEFSFEKLHYNQMTIPVQPSYYNVNDHKEYRQPLLYIQVNNKLLIFHDFPGERLKTGKLPILQNVIPVYFYDPDQNHNLDKLCSLFQSIHYSQQYSREILLLSKCDLIDDVASKIMIKPYSETAFNEYSELHGARTMCFLPELLPHECRILFEKLRNNRSNIDVLCVAPYGCNTVSNSKTGKLELCGQWEPKFLYDFLLTLTM